MYHFATEDKEFFIDTLSCTFLFLDMMENCLDVIYCEILECCSIYNDIEMLFYIQSMSETHFNNLLSFTADDENSLECFISVSNPSSSIFYIHTLTHPGLNVYGVVVKSVQQTGVDAVHEKLPQKVYITKKM